MPDETEFILVQITTQDEYEAQRLAQILLEQRKAACVNILPKISSVYRWQGKIENGTESQMLVKTRHALLDDVIKLIKTHHSYQLPEVIAIKIHGGDDEYLNWIENETQS